jgi:hypothetical protein
MADQVMSVTLTAAGTSKQLREKKIGGTNNKKYGSSALLNAFSTYVTPNNIPKIIRNHKG